MTPPPANVDSPTRSIAWFLDFVLDRLPLEQQLPIVEHFAEKLSVRAEHLRAQAERPKRPPSGTMRVVTEIGPPAEQRDRNR